MSCGCGCNNGTASTCPDCTSVSATNETLQSALENFITSFFGTVTKTVVDGRVQWTLPCDLETGLPNNTRLTDEGLACYFLRLFREGIIGLTGPRGDTGAAGADGSDAYTVLTATFSQPDETCPNIQVEVENGSLFSQGLYVFIEDSGYYTVVETSDNTIFLELVELTTGGYTLGETVPVGTLVLPIGPRGVQGARGAKGDTGETGAAGPTGPAGADGADGAGSRFQVLSNYTQPAVGATVVVTLDRAQDLNVDEIVYVANGGYYRVDAVAAPTVTLENLYDTTYNAAPGATVGPSVQDPTYLYIAGVRGAEGSVYTTLTAGFTAPSVGSTVTIVVGSTAALTAGRKVFIEAGVGFYEVVSITNATDFVGRRLMDTNQGSASGAVGAAGTKVWTTDSPSVNYFDNDNTGTGDYSPNMTFGNSGFSVTLPAAGTYLLLAQVRVEVEGTGYVRARFYDATAAAAVGNETEFTNPSASTITNTIPLMAIYTAPAGATINLQALDSSNAGSPNAVVEAGGTTLQAIRLY